MEKGVAEVRQRLATVSLSGCQTMITRLEYTTVGQYCCGPVNVHVGANSFLGPDLALRLADRSILPSVDRPSSVDRLSSAQSVDR